MPEKAMESTTTTLKHENEGEGSVIKNNHQVLWSFDTNWILAHGSLEAAVAIESSDYPIVGSDPETTLRKPPLVLMPRGPQSGPCEIKIHFCQKYDIGQIYVRSTARVYEIYYAHSPQSSNEYLCTVRCGVAERDEKLYQKTGLEDVSEEHGDCFVGELTEDVVTDKENIFTSEDDWVNVGIPTVKRNSLPNNTFTKKVNNVQDLYEATAQISDADPCSSLTIRLLSLLDKGHACVDEVYVFADPVDLIDSGNESVPAGSSAGTSLMAMLVPTLLQLSKSGVSQAQDKRISDEVLKDDKMGTELTRIDEIDVASANNQVDQQHVKLQELNKDKNVSSELQQPGPALITKKCIEPVDVNDLLSERLDRALEQLISRVNRVEEICLRFEEKMLKPIESMELRLQQVEHQLEKLSKNSDYSSFPHCTRIAAPAFSCSESNSSSLYNEGINYPTCGASEIEKKGFSCNNTSNSSHDSNFRPTLVVSAPEFSCGEDGDNDNFKPLKDTPCKQKKTLTVDDALAEALSGFLSTAKIHGSEFIQTTSDFSSEKDEYSQQLEHALSHQMKAEEFPDAENGPGKPSQYIPILTVTAPEFTAEDVGDEVHLNCSPSSSDMVSVFMEGKDHVDEMRNGSTRDFGSAPDIGFRAVSSRLIRMHLADGHLNIMPDLNMPDCSFEGDTSSNSMRNSDVSPPDLAKDSAAFGNQIHDETNPGETIDVILDTEDITLKKGLERQSESTSDVVARYVVGESCFKDAVPNVFKSSYSSILNFETPILEVKFASDAYSNTRCPLEALFDGAAGLNIEASLTSSDIRGDNNGTTEQITTIFVDGNEPIDLIPSNYLLVDLEASDADGYLNLEGDQSHDLCTPDSTEMFVSLI